MKDVLISYTNTDRPWTEWMTWVLEENGYTVTAQAWETLEGKQTLHQWRNAIVHRRNAQSINVDNHRLLLIVLSNVYLQTVTSYEEGVDTLWPILLNRSPILIRVEDVDLSAVLGVELSKILSSRVYVNLADVSEAEAEQAILTALETTEADRLSSHDTDAEPEETIQTDGSDGQLKQRRQSHTVQFFVEPLNENAGIEMVLIPAGTFLMGSPEDEVDRTSRESPQHEVSVPTFFMSKYPITQAQWRFVAELPQVDRELDRDPSNFKGDNRPVEQVSWYDVVEFCDRLSRFVESRLSAHSGREYRLPTEAEWEYACRAGTTTPFHFGETITTDLANYDGTDDPDGKWSGSYGRGLKGEYRRETTLVDHFGIANAFGLCDMHGNVFEWCLDHWHGSYEGAPIDGSAWLTEDENSNRLLRGGSWLVLPRLCRSAYRYYISPVSRVSFIGFRVVCVAPRTL